jgi:hypothetical protein
MGEIYHPEGRFVLTAAAVVLRQRAPPNRTLVDYLSVWTAGNVEFASRARCQRRNEGETMRVKNLNGTAQDKPRSGSWLRHWEEVSGQNAWMCFVQGCIRRPIEGGRVQKDTGVDRGWYVIPLCTECNGKQGQDLDIWDAARLVLATERVAVGIRTEPSKAAAAWTRKAVPAV